MAEQRVRLPPDPRPRGTPPSLPARRLLFELEARGHVVSVETAPPRLLVRPAAPEEWDRLIAHAYELRQLLAEERPA